MKKLLNRTIKAGGVAIQEPAARRIFGGDARLRRNILEACKSPALAAAIQADLIQDHRVIEVMGRIDTTAARIVLAVEMKLGRKIERSRMERLTARYACIRDLHIARRAATFDASMTRTRQLLAAISARLETAGMTASALH